MILLNYYEFLLSMFLTKGNFSDKLNERLEQILFPWCKFTTVFDKNEKNIYFLLFF
jgi:hypothetical protein